ncbi:hypothetical protein K491DRAFT_677113 [Lophiostoma macrostomum CBS 122681]|uniref:Mis12-domain-containing protein n=1 Tax=Lophiostoma macrostomum CBS 122681 TaxID=1314788 RepID=A0A6A6TCC5_9PLEO|nr:hypothetical protein K491DRAFT_677113 [Lophiostoma macrostomum CBS 122681]
MATQKQQENMLLTEHFTWPPIALLDEIINHINEILYKCTEAMDTGLSSAPPSALGFAERAAAEGQMIPVDEDGNEEYPGAKLEIEEGVLKLETLMENAVDKNFDKLEIWTLRNVLCLPREKDGGRTGTGTGTGDGGLEQWIRLGGYEDLPTPSKNPSLTPESLHALRRKLQETQTLHAALLAEKARNAAQIQRLRSLLQPQIKREPRSSTSPSKSTASAEAPFAFLTHSDGSRALGIPSLPPPHQTSTASHSHGNGNGNGNGNPPNAASSNNPLTTHTQFTTSQLPYLRKLLASLHPHLATTALPSRSDGAKEELARERKVYIESQSRRVLEQGWGRGQVSCVASESDTQVKRAL